MLLIRMRSLSPRIITLFFVALACGCMAAPSQRQIWVTQQGGTIAGPDQIRAERVAGNLTCCCCKGTSINIQVFNSPVLAAYSWPDGKIFLSRGLMDQLDDQELSAAVAHEMGHLLGVGAIHSIASLRGDLAKLDVEKRADAIGVELLKSRGIGAGAMVRMLTKVECSSSLPVECRAAIHSRILAVAAGS
jgi:predicted Zn-dependent protease